MHIVLHQSILVGCGGIEPSNEPMCRQGTPYMRTYGMVAELVAQHGIFSHDVDISKCCCSDNDELLSSMISSVARVRYNSFFTVPSTICYVP